MPKKRFTLGDKLSHFVKLLLIIPNCISLAKSVLRLIQKELSIAGKNLVIILMLSFVLACLFTATWLGVLAILFLILLHLQWAWLTALLTVLGLNILLMIMTAVVMNNIKKHILFPEIRKQLFHRQRNKS